MALPSVLSTTQLFYNSNDTNTSVSQSLAISSAAMAVVVYVMNDLARSVNACTLGGTAMTQAITYIQSDMRTSIYYRLSPGSGSKTVAVTMSSGCRLAVVAVQIGLVRATGPTDGAGKVSNTITMSVTTSLPNYLIVSGACCNTQNITNFSGTTLSSGTNQLRYSIGYTTAANPATRQITYTLAADPTYGASAASLALAGILGQQFGIRSGTGL